MKKITKLALTLSLGYLGQQTVTAIKEKRSLQSKLFAHFLNALTNKVTPSTEDGFYERYENELEKQLEPYQIPPIAEKQYGFKTSTAFSDTMLYNPLWKDQAKAIEANSENQQVIFYLHGGAYWSQPTIFHYRMLHKLANLSGARIVMPIYPKAPTQHVKDAHLMVLARYLYLLNVKKVSPENIIFMGDSSGGGLALTLMQQLRDHHISLPRAGVFMAPWVDVSNSNPFARLIEPYDPMLDLEFTAFQGKVYAQPFSVTDPLVSPNYGSYYDLPPMQIYVGTHDMLFADMINIQSFAEQDNLPIEIISFEKMGHVFPAYPIPEADRALEQMATYIQSVQVK